MSDEPRPYRTKTGRVLTDADALADEARRLASSLKDCEAERIALADALRAAKMPALVVQAIINGATKKPDEKSPAPNSSDEPIADRRVHARTADGCEIVRYDRASKWFMECDQSTRRAGTQSIPRRSLTLDLAVRQACADGSTVFLGRPGGRAFDAGVKERIQRGLRSNVRVRVVEPTS